MDTATRMEPPKDKRALEKLVRIAGLTAARRNGHPLRRREVEPGIARMRATRGHGIRAQPEELDVRS